MLAFKILNLNSKLIVQSGNRLEFHDSVPIHDEVCPYITYVVTLVIYGYYTLSLIRDVPLTQLHLERVVVDALRVPRSKSLPYLLRNVLHEF